MKVWLDHDECYPSLIERKHRDCGATMVEAPDELVGRFRKAGKEFLKAHGELLSLYEKASGKTFD